MTIMNHSSTDQDFLWLNVRELPFFRALLRAVEAREYQDIEMPGPIFDLGCGDGQFVTTAFTHPVDVGLDPWKGPVQEAAQRKSYRLTVWGDGHTIPFSNESFASAMSNSVLEHIPDLDPVLCEVFRILKPGAKFVFCVPNHRFLANLSISNFFDRIRLKPLANGYRNFFNRISRHHHCDDFATWKARLDQAGFVIEQHWDYFSPAATHVLEWGHYLGLPSLILHFFTHRWIAVPARWNLGLLMRWLQRFYMEDRHQDDGSYSFYVVRKPQS